MTDQETLLLDEATHFARDFLKKAERGISAEELAEISAICEKLASRRVGNQVVSSAVSVMMALVEHVASE